MCSRHWLGECFVKRTPGRVGSGQRPGYAALPGPAALGGDGVGHRARHLARANRFCFLETLESGQRRRSWGPSVRSPASPGPPWNCFTEVHLNLRLTQKGVTGNGSEASGSLLSKGICVPFLCGVSEILVGCAGGQPVYITRPQEESWTPRQGGLPWLAGPCRHTLLLREVGTVHVPPRGGDTRKLVSGAFSGLHVSLCLYPLLIFICVLCLQ